MFEHRYILASALQKSIRRGLTDYALIYAQHLFDNDYNYLIYRLGIILTEDVGVSNTLLLNKYLDLKISKKKIEEAGGFEFIKNIIYEACNSIKDRTSCDLAYFSSRLTNWSINKPEFQKVIKASKEDRLNIILDTLKENINPCLKVNLIWAALGQRKYPNDNLSNLNLFDFPKLKNGKNDDSIENFNIILKSLDLKEDEISATINAHATQNEFMCLGMSITYQERNIFINQPEYALKIEENNFSKDTVSIMKNLNIPILNSAIDHHTSQGKAAYTLFLRQESNFKTYLKNKGFNDVMISKLLPFFMFRIEGHEVDKREYFPFAAKIMFMASQIAMNLQLGLDFNDKSFSFKEISQELKKDIPFINEFRFKALNFNNNFQSRASFNI